MIAFLLSKVSVEVLALILNAAILLSFVFKRPFEPGKFLYWLGATILTIGLLKMRG